MSHFVWKKIDHLVIDLNPIAKAKAYRPRNVRAECFPLCFHWLKGNNQCFTMRFELKSLKGSERVKYLILLVL